MKNLFNAQKESRNENFAGNLLYFSGGPDGPAAPTPEKEDSVEQKINKALKSPLGFGSKEMMFLEKHQKEMTSVQERRFRNIAGYQLSLARGKDIQDLPPRILTSLAESTLLKLLPKRMQNQIVVEVDTQMKDLNSIVSKNADQWSSFELSKVCTLYRRLRKNAVKKDGLRDGVFEDARKGIIKKAFNLIKKPITTSSMVDNTISKEDNKPMTLQEKLLVLEIRRMFPRDRDWAEKSKFYDWDKKAVETISDLFKDNEKRTSMLANPNMAFTWELLRGFLGKNPDTDAPGALRKKIIDKVGENELDKAFKTAEAIKFLQFAKNSRIFLPTHLQALQQIIDKKIEIEEIDDLKSWENHSEEGDKLNKLRDKLKKIKEKSTKVEQYGLTEYFGLSEDKRKKELEQWEKEGVVDMVQLGLTEKQYKEVEKEKTEYLNNICDTKLKEWIEKGKKAWEKTKDVKLKNLDLEEVKEKLKIENVPEDKKAGYLKTITDNFKAQRERIEGVPEKFAGFETDRQSLGNDFKKQENFINKFRDFLNDQGVEVKKENEYEEYDKEYKEYLTGLQKWKDRENKIAREVPIKESLKEERSKLQTDISKLTKKVESKTKEVDTYRLWGDLLKDPAKVADEAKATFISNFNTRIRNKNLYAADFEVLWGEEMNEERLFSPETNSYEPNPYYEELSKFREELETLPNKAKVDEFREKFQTVLGGIFDEVELSKLSDSEDKFAPWYRELDEALSYDNIIARLKEEGFDLRQEFQSPQQITQLIDGAIRTHRDGIFNVIRSNTDELSADEEKEFYAGWDRLHGGLDGATDPTEVHRKHIRYENDKLKTSERIENAHQVNEAYVDRLKKKAAEEQNPAKKAHYEEEARKLEESFPYRKHAYERGGNFWGKDSEGNDKLFWAPGKEFLNELDLQTQSITKEIKAITDDLKTNISEIAESFRGISDIKDPLEKKLKQSQAQSNLQELFSKWEATHGNLQTKFQNMGTIINEVIPGGVAPDQFTDVLLEVPMKILESFDETFKDLQKYARKVDFKFTGKEAFWGVFADNFTKLENALNFQDGLMAKNGNKLDKYLEESNKTLEFLTKIQFFDDNTAEKDEFTENYDVIKKEFKKDFAEYEEAVNDVNRRLSRDISHLKDEDFFNKYGLQKEYMQDLLDQHKNTANNFKDISEKFMKPNFLKDWIHRYDMSPQDRVEAIAEMGDFNALRDHAKNARDYAANMKKWVTEYDDNTGNKAQGKYQRFSLYDLYAIVKQAIEVNERRWKRDSDKAVAEIGMNFFGAESAWGKEFKQKAEESEEARVKEFETQYGEYTGWALQEALYASNDADESKALIRLLLEKGFMQWDDPSFWRTLMRLSNNAVVFQIPEDKNLSRLEILNKVRNSCEFIWSKETFRDWDTSMKGKLDTAIKGYEADFDRYEDDPNARTQILATMLQRWKNGDSTNVDPARFECFVSESFKKGKMNGQPDQRWYFMVMGVATINPNTGKSLISRDVFMRMNAEHMPKFPHLEFLTDKESYKLNGMIVPEGTTGAEERGWEFEDYLAWGKFLGDGNGSFNPKTSELIKEQTKRFFYHIVNMSPTAQSRVSRMDRIAGGEADHDDAESFFAAWVTTHVVATLSKSSGGEKKATFDLWRGYLAGFPTYMEYMRKYIEEGDAKWRDLPGWKEQRELKLKEVGDRFKTALVVLQTLQGNGNLGESRGSLVMDSEEWRRDSAMSVNADKSREVINSFTRQVFEKAGGGEEFEELLDFKGAVEYGVNYKDRQKKLEESGIEKKFKKLLETPESSAKYFQNTTVIEDVLMNWGSGSAGKIINLNSGGGFSAAA